MNQENLTFRTELSGHCVIHLLSRTLTHNIEFIRKIRRTSQVSIRRKTFSKSSIICTAPGTTLISWFSSVKTACTKNTAGAIGIRSTNLRYCSVILRILPSPTLQKEKNDLFWKNWNIWSVRYKVFEDSKDH